MSRIPGTSFSDQDPPATTKPQTPLRTLQLTLPWGGHDYSERFTADDAPHRDYFHAIKHLDKARAKFNEMLDAVDHKGVDWAKLYADERKEHIKGIVDLVICATRCANTYPTGAIDLQAEYDARIAEKFGAPK